MTLILKTEMRLYFFEKIMEIYKSIIPERHAENIEYM